MYFPLRDLADSILLIDRFAELGRPVHVTETGATSGPSPSSVKLDTVPLPTAPYAWHRPWDEICRPMGGEASIRWRTAGRRSRRSAGTASSIRSDTSRTADLLRSPAGDRKPVFDRLARLRSTWSQSAPAYRPAWRGKASSRLTTAATDHSAQRADVGDERLHFFRRQHLSERRHAAGLAVANRRRDALDGVCLLPRRRSHIDRMVDARPFPGGSVALRAMLHEDGQRGRRGGRCPVVRRRRRSGSWRLGGRGRRRDGA